MTGLAMRRSIRFAAIGWALACAAILLLRYDPVVAQDDTDTAAPDAGLVATARIVVRSDPQSVFSAFADPACMSRFWFTRHDDGLIPGKTISWFLGTAENALSFEVRIIEVVEPERIVIEWPDYDGSMNRVTWTMQETDTGDTLLTIIEAGFRGSPEEITERALNSTGGFNQVILAAKALIEHDVAINVVADHP